MSSNKLGLAELKRLHLVAKAAKAEVVRTVEARKVAPSSPPDDAHAFAQAVRATRPLAVAPRVIHTKRPDAIPEGAAARRVAAVGATPTRADRGVSDGDLTHMLSENGTAYVRADAAPDTARRLRKGQWRVGAELDLHGLRVEQARHAMVSFLSECLEHGIRCVRVVHGKGYGSRDAEPVLKDKVRSWLIQLDTVLAFTDTPEKEGGAGAVLALLNDATPTRC